MINVALAIVFGVVGIALGVGYNFLVIKHYPDQRRKGAYVLTVFLFLICALVLFCVVSVRPNINKAIAENMTKMEQYINETHASNGLVKNGLDLKKIGSDSSQIQWEIKALLPTYQQIGLPKIVYDIVVDNALGELGKKLRGVNISTDEPIAFADENNVLTVASLTNGIQQRAIKLVNIIFLVIASIFAVLLIIYIIKSLLTARKARKTVKTENVSP
jgi:large-conductance mechanosensitive channel